MQTKNNLDSRDAKRIIHSQDFVLRHVPVGALPYVVRGFAKNYGMQAKIMLKAMKHYIRISKTL